jgi:hypothetical membrane protein
MQKEIIILSGLIIVLLIFIFFLFVQNTSLRNDNYFIAQNYFSDMNNLIQICEIDYDAYMNTQRQQFYSDLNTRFTKKYKVG